MKLISMNLMPGPEEAHNGVVTCHNLRPMHGCLMPAPLPIVVAKDGWRVLASVPLSSGAVLLYTRGQQLAVMQRGLVASSVDLPEVPLAATATVAGKVLVMTAGGAYMADVTASSVKVDAVEPPALPRLRVDAVGKVSTVVNALKFSCAYASGESILAVDANRVSTAVNKAWDELDADARAAGLWWQPMVAMARLVSAEGHEIMSTPPVLLRGEDEFCGPIQLQSDDNRTTLPLTLNAWAWQIAVDMPAASAMPQVSRVEVVVAPMLHYADNSQPAMVALRQRASDQYFVSAGYSPSGLGLRSSGKSGSAQLVADVVARMDRLGQVVAVLKPEAEATTVMVAAAPASTPKADRSALSAALARKPEAASRAAAWLSAPHQISATTMCSTAGIVALAGLSVKPYAGYGAEALAAKVENASWHAAVKVELSDGSSRVVTSEGTTAAPTAFSPVLSYPSAEAVKMTITTKVTGRGTFRGEFALTPDTSGRRSIYVDSSLRPIELPSADAYVVPDEECRRVEFSDYVAVAPAEAALSPTAITRLSGCSVVALKPAVSASQNLDFGRQRIFALGSGGIHALTVKGGAAQLTSNLLDTRPVESAAAVIYANNALMAVAGGDIVGINRAAVTTYLSGVNAAALAWDGSRSELWAINKGAVTVYCTRRRMRSYTLGLEADPALTSSIESQSFVGDTSGQLYRVGSDGLGSQIDVKWQGYAQVEATGRQIVVLNAVGTLTTISLAAARAHLNKVAPGPVWSTMANHAGKSFMLHSPMSRVVVIPIAGMHLFTVSATASPTTVFTDIKLERG
jgi:hypothetical protein